MVRDGRGWLFPPGRFLYTPRVLRRLAVVGLLLAAGLACDSSSPAAPPGSTLTISANPLEIDVDGSSQITVIARKSTGFPVSPGTLIILSTTLGEVSPSTLATNDNGVAKATLFGTGADGTAIVTAAGGGATDASVAITVGSGEEA